MRAGPYLLLSLTCFFWSLNFVIGKLVGGVIPPITIALFRWLLPMLAFLAFAWRELREDARVYRARWRLLLVLGLSGYSLNAIAVYEAVHYTTTINTSFINAFNPVMIAVTGFLLYRYPVNAAQALGFALSLVGVVWVIFRGEPARILELRANVGDLAMVGSLVTWSIHTIVYKRHAASLPRRSLFAAMIVAGVASMVPLAVAENAVVGLGWTRLVGPRHLLGLVALSVFPSVLAYRFWNAALERISANRAAMFQYLIPVYTVLLSVVFLRERLEAFQLMGGALIFAGVLLATTRGAEDARPAVSAGPAGRGGEG